jgi:hypothetical protein
MILDVKLSQFKLCSALRFVRDREDLADLPLAQQMYANSSEQLKLFKREYCKYSCSHFDSTCVWVDKAIEGAEALEAAEKERQKGG